MENQGAFMPVFSDSTTRKCQTFHSDYCIGDMVYLITDELQQERMIIAIKFTMDGKLYQLVNGTSDSYHYELEIAREKDVLKLIGVDNE